MFSLYHETSPASRKIRTESNQFESLRGEAVRLGAQLTEWTARCPSPLAPCASNGNLRNGAILIAVSSSSSAPRGIGRTSEDMRLMKHEAARDKQAASCDEGAGYTHSISITIGSSSTASVGILWIWSTGPTARPFSSKWFGRAVSSKGRAQFRFSRRTALGRPG